MFDSVCREDEDSRNKKRKSNDRSLGINIVSGSVRICGNGPIVAELGLRRRPHLVTTRAE